MKTKFTKKSGVYKITNNVTGDYYIGSSTNFHSRWLHHTAESTWKQEPRKLLYIEMAKYGVENFEFSIVEELENPDKQTLREREKYYIDSLNPAYNTNSINLTKEEARLKKNECTREWKKVHADYNRALNRNWARNNPDKIREYHKKYKAKVAKSC